MAANIRILGFGFSLRAGSYSRIVMESAKSLLPPGAELELFDIGGIPPFNQDLDSDQPQSVKDFKAKIRGADALLIITPEYNYSIPGYLKNAMDWATRPPSDNSFDGKPTALMSSSNGMHGGSRAQYHMRQVFLFINVRAVTKPEVFLATVQDKIKDGVFVDEKGRDVIRRLLSNLVKLASEGKEK